MLITVDRRVTDGEATISEISVDGVFVCYGFEDQHRTGEKVPGETRIPAGEYPVTLRTVGGFHSRYRRRNDVKDMHQGMLWVRDVPNFEFILFHIGNRKKDTEGCILTGTSANSEPGNMSVGGSAKAYQRFYPMVVRAAANNQLSVRVINNDLPK